MVQWICGTYMYNNQWVTEWYAKRQEKCRTAVSPLLTDKLSVRPLLTDKLPVKGLLTDKLSVRLLLSDKLSVRKKKESFFHGLMNIWREKN